MVGFFFFVVEMHGPALVKRSNTSNAARFLVDLRWVVIVNVKIVAKLIFVVQRVGMPKVQPHPLFQTLKLKRIPEFLRSTKCDFVLCSKDKKDKGSYLPIWNTFLVKLNNLCLWSSSTLSCRSDWFPWAPPWKHVVCDSSTKGTFCFCGDVESIQYMLYTCILWYIFKIYLQ